MSRRILQAFLACSFIASFSHAQHRGEDSYRDVSTLPDDTRAERIQAFTGLLNDASPEAVRRFFQDHCTAHFRDAVPMEVHLDANLRLARETGGIDFHSIRLYNPPRSGETVVIVRDRNYGSWKGLLFRFGEEPGTLIDGLEFAPARTPTDVEEPALDKSGAMKAVGELVKRLCDRDLFSGSILVAKEDEVLFQHSCGEASKRFHAPNRIDTKFNLGSMNKMFTAVAVAQLVEKGKLRYEDTLDRFVNENWLPKEITSRIQIHHLLSHTSGLGSYFNDVFWKSSRGLYRSLEDYKPLVKGETLAFKPGERFRYSNTGMFLLGVVIENVTGQTYFDYVRDHIYGPAEMNDSDSYDMDVPVANLAIGYIPDPGTPYGWRNNLFKHVIRGGPAGGGFSTAGDLNRFARALQEGELVSAETLQLLWTDKSGQGYGYGFVIRGTGSSRVVGHGGGFPGLSANLDIFVNRGFIVSVLSNYDTAADPLAARVRDFLLRIAPR